MPRMEDATEAFAGEQRHNPVEGMAVRRMLCTGVQQPPSVTTSHFGATA